MGGRAVLHVLRLLLLVGRIIWAMSIWGICFALLLLLVVRIVQLMLSQRMGNTLLLFPLLLSLCHRMGKQVVSVLFTEDPEGRQGVSGLGEGVEVHTSLALSAPIGGHCHSPQHIVINSQSSVWGVWVTVGNPAYKASTKFLLEVIADELEALHILQYAAQPCRQALKSIDGNAC